MILAALADLKTTIKENQAKNELEVATVKNDHNARLASLELSRNRSDGVLKLAFAIAGMIGSALTLLVTLAFPYFFTPRH